ncbi:hypothetical protein ABT297_17145 [Dactylosporangium sp. NPDC000555]|uniref:GHMP family kinase ATP-binding protein n=1 Tax=Dactylosporangium sp. NPDC000555 TaxID=3154260 RepID=UPI003320684D
MSLPLKQRPERMRFAGGRARQLGDATVHGTFGELLQGYRQQPDGGFEHFLVTLPVQELCTTSTVSLTRGRGGHRVQPADRARALAATTDLAHALGLYDVEIDLSVNSNIPVGKGCASSTADIMASLAALVAASAPDTPQRVLHALGTLVARNIEWGDYVLSDSITLCLQRSHTLVRTYDTDLRWRILGVDEDGSVDTAEFHRRERESRRLALHYATLLSQLDAALMMNDFATAAQIATESAVINQRVLPKRNFELMRRVAGTTGALGIAVAHTGTVIGLIFSEHQSDFAARLREAKLCLRRKDLTGRIYTVRDSDLLQPPSERQ